MIKGKYTFKTGHTDSSAYATISNVGIDFQKEVAGVGVQIYKSETAKNNGAEPEFFKFVISKEAQEVKHVETDEVVLTLPAFDDVFGVEKLQEENYNPVMALYAILMTFPKFTEFE